MHYVRAWKFKPSLIFVTVLVVLISSAFGLLVADVSGLINLGNFGVAIAMLVILPIPTIIFACLTVGKYEEVKAEKIAEFEVDRKWEVKYYRWLYLLFAVAGVILGLAVNIVFFALPLYVVLLTLTVSRHKIKVSITDRGICYQGFLIEWNEIKRVRILDDYIVLYKSPFRIVAIPKEASNLIDKFLQKYFDSKLQLAGK